MAEKSWPDDDGTADYGDLVLPLREALVAGYRLERKLTPAGIEWNGLPQGKLTNAQCLEPSEALSAEILVECEEDQGEDLLDVILGIALRLGIEQGRRISRERQAGSIHATHQMLQSALEGFERTFGISKPDRSSST